MLICAPDAMVTGFGLANPKLHGEREAVLLPLSFRYSMRTSRGGRYPFAVWRRRQL